MTQDRLPEPEPVGGPGSAAGATGAGGPGGWVRILDGLAGLLAAGILLVGVLLLLAAVIAPALLPAVDLGAAAGPGWDRVIVHLVVGGAGEVVVRFRGRWPTTARVAADSAVVVIGLAVIGWGWWP